ncbi:MAG TPA: hypothetical protein VNE82_15995 [Candidatus Binataceae bacterium]|nr:hypothetical protein [Candidatus Binataceae bacterium]
MPGKGLIRSLNRRGTRSDKSPVVVRKSPVAHEPTVCERCAAVFERKTWRRGRKLTHTALEKAAWALCPACKQVAREEYTGRVLLRGLDAGADLDAIRARVQNVARRASFTQPERRLVAADWSGRVPELLTTSQKLAHRIVHELKKAFGGRASYRWSDDGTLLATWHRTAARGAHA